MDEKALKILEFDQVRELLLAKATCELSRRAISELEPQTDIDEISRLLSETESAVNCVLKRGTPPSAGIADLTGAIRRSETEAVLTPGELLKIAAMLTAVRRLQSYCEMAEGAEPSFVEKEIIELVPLRTLEGNITRAILSEEEIADDASPELHDIRRKIFQQQSLIRDKLNDLTHSAKYAKALQDSIVTVRGDRYCVPVKVENRSEIPGIVHDTSSSGQTLFVEPAFVVDANNKIRELKAAEQTEIARILKELSGDVAAESGILMADLKSISYLDFTFAKAAYALENSCTRPELNEDGVIALLKARHPLLNRKTAVPITVTLGMVSPEHNVPVTCMVITGPNTGGKTVTLKTVGLLHIMAQSGLLIPAAEHSKISVFESIYADIGDEQSISQSLSTFSAHMKNITGILEGADDRSLILFDELGAGTDPTEGAALAMAILECTRQLGSKVLATTHYSELKVFASTTPGFINASCEFDVDTLAPTYKLLIGIPGKSNAFAISQKLGLDPQIIARAAEFISAEDLRFEDMLKGIERDRAQTEAALRESELLRADAQKLREEIAAEREDLINRSAELKHKAALEARENNNKARMAADKMLTEIRRAALLGGAEAVRVAEAARRQFEEDISGTEAASISSEAVRHASGEKLNTAALKPGDRVHLISLNCDAEVLAEPKSDGTVSVKAGSLKLFAKLTDLTAPVGKKQAKPANTLAARAAANASSAAGSGKGSGKASASMRGQNVRTEVDVRGMTVSEAEAQITRHINEAYLSGQNTFTIIHGKGTGALRRGVQQFLSGSPEVESFRDGAFGEGDLGVTVVTLKS